MKFLCKLSSIRDWENESAPMWQQIIVGVLQCAALLAWFFEMAFFCYVFG